MARQSSSSSSAVGNGHPSPVHEPSDSSPDASNKRSDSPSHFDFKNDPRHKAASKALPFDASLLPKGSRSLASIGLQAFFVGNTLSGCLLTAIYLAINGNTIWRLPAFFACLSVFHFLEYYTTARFNLPAARASSFLLFSNGTAYNVAHTFATIEIIASNYLPSYQLWLISVWTIALGSALVFIGQTVRSVAMAQAGTNFNHTPAKTREEGHDLVTTGVYGFLRHPSYFGFFWWALGTQVLVGNKVCTVGYACALWKFFYDRIIGESCLFTVSVCVRR